MELEELRNIWQSHTSAVITDENRTAEDIRALLNKRSQGALSRINRSIRAEVIGVLLLGVIFGGAILFNPSEFWSYELSFLLIWFVGSLVLYRYMYKVLNQIEIGTDNLKGALIHINEKMSRFMKLSKYAVKYLIPFMAIAGYTYGLYRALLEKGESFMNLTFQEWGIITLALIIYIILALWFIRWYIHKLYGVHHSELKACLNELLEYDGNE